MVRTAHPTQTAAATQNVGCAVRTESQLSFDHRAENLPIMQVTVIATFRFLNRMVSPVPFRIATIAP